MKRISSGNCHLDAEIKDLRHRITKSKMCEI